MNYKTEFEAVLELELKPDSNGQALVRCPFHDDRKPSLSINITTGVWNCFAGCGGGNLYQLAERLGKPLKYKPERKTVQKAEILNEAIEKLHTNLTKEYRQFWYARGINDETLNKVKIGYEPKTGFYIFPYDDEQGNCWAYKKINEKKDEFWYPTGAEGIRLFNIQDIDRARAEGVPLCVAEGEKDGLVLLMCGYRCIGVSGVNGFKDEYAGLFHGIKDIVICYDNDPPGQINGKKVAELIGYRARLLIWRDIDPKDINDLYLKDRENFKADFDQLVRDAKPQAKPFLSPACQDFDEIVDYCRRTTENKIIGIPTGFYKLDRFLGGQL